LKPEDWPEEIKYEITENGEVLTFAYIRASASGLYTCTARNRNGTDSTFLDIEVHGMMKARNICELSLKLSICSTKYFYSRGF